MVQYETIAETVMRCEGLSVKKLLELTERKLH